MKRITILTILFISLSLLSRENDSLVTTFENESKSSTDYKIEEIFTLSKQELLDESNVVPKKKINVNYIKSCTLSFITKEGDKQFMRFQDKETSVKYIKKMKLRTDEDIVEYTIVYITKYVTGRTVTIIDKHVKRRNN